MRWRHTEPVRQRLSAEGVPEWLSGTGSPCFAAKCVSPWSGHIFLGLSFLSSKIKDLKDLSSLTFHDLNSRGSSPFLLLCKPHEAAVSSKIDRVQTTVSFWPMIRRVGFYTSGWGSLNLFGLLLCLHSFLLFFPSLCFTVSLFHMSQQQRKHYPQLELISMNYEDGFALF